MTFVSGENAGQSIAKLKMKNPSSLGKYLIPIEVKHDIFIGDTYYLILDDEIHLREDMLYAPFHVGYDGKGLIGLIDDDPKTFWHTPYKDHYYYDEEYGHWFQIKFDRRLDHEMQHKIRDAAMSLGRCHGQSNCGPARMTALLGNQLSISTMTKVPAFRDGTKAGSLRYTLSPLRA